MGDGTLRATQPAALNDPFECAVATAYVFEDEAEEDGELAKVLTEINENKPISAIEVLTARIEYGSLFTRQLLSDQISTRFRHRLVHRESSPPIDVVALQKRTARRDGPLCRLR